MLTLNACWVKISAGDFLRHLSYFPTIEIDSDCVGFVVSGFLNLTGHLGLISEPNASLYNALHAGIKIQFHFCQKIGFKLSCKLSPMETICKKC